MYFSEDDQYLDKEQQPENERYLDAIMFPSGKTGVNEINLLPEFVVTPRNRRPKQTNTRNTGARPKPQKDFSELYLIGGILLLVALVVFFYFRFFKH